MAAPQEVGFHSVTGSGLNVAVLIPCYNEAGTIAQAFDDSATRAARAGAIVRRERHQGKGHVVRRMFADVDAALYVMVDRDGTYDAAAALGAVIELVENQLDFINIARRGTTSEAYRPGFTSLATLC